MVGPFETSRLSVRSWRDDLTGEASRAALEKALSPVLTPPVLRALPEPLWISEKEAGVSKWIDDRNSESDVWLVLDKANDAVIGLLILAQMDGPETPSTIHVGYLLAQHAWGQGYATELVTGLVTAARAVGSLQLIGGVSSDNPASVKVLRNAGFLPIPELSSTETKMFGLTID